MGDKTGIQWTDATWNPIVGCSITSPGCTNCYAMKMAARIEAMHFGRHVKHAPSLAAIPPTPYEGTTQDSNAGSVWTGKVAQASDDTLTLPLRWKRPRRIFVNSMGDLFHESVPDAWIDRVFAVMALSPRHTFQVLTKRSARMRAYMVDLLESETRFEALCDAAADLIGALGAEQIGDVDLPLPNVWLGVSAEDQRRADERVPDLLATPAAVRFVSAEPLLGPIDFNAIDVGAYMRNTMGARARPASENDPVMKWPLLATFDHMQSGYSSPGLDWIIVGGESGPGARPMRPGWAREIRDQCAAAGVAYFFKQWSEWGGLSKHAAGRLLDGVEHSEYPGATS